MIYRKFVEQLNNVGLIFGGMSCVNIDDKWEYELVVRAKNGQLYFYNGHSYPNPRSKGDSPDEAILTFMDLMNDWQLILDTGNEKYHVHFPTFGLEMMKTKMD